MNPNLIFGIQIGLAPGIAALLISIAHSWYRRKRRHSQWSAASLARRAEESAS